MNWIKPRTLVLTLIALILAGTLGYKGFAEYRKRSQHELVMTLVADATVRLNGALRADAGVSADPLSLASQFEAQAAELDQRLETLRRAGTAPNVTLFDAGELYLITTREFMRRKAASFRQAIAVEQSRKTLQGLMRSAGRRSGTWISQTMRAKEDFEKNVFSYRLSVDAMGNLLESYPAMHAQLKEYGAPIQPLDEGLRTTAQAQARVASKSAAAEVEQVRSFVAQ